MNLTMQEEIPNNDRNWKQRLNELDELPADPPVNLLASWEKLYHKLGTKKKNRKAIGWYAAAASVILAFLLLIQPEKRTENYTNTTIPEAKKIDTLSHSLTAKTPQHPSIKTDSRPVMAKRKTPVHLKKPRPPKIEKQPEMDQHESLTVEAPLVINVPNAPAVVQQSVAAAPVRKKLRVVHINELTNNTVPQEATARKSRIRSIKPNNDNIAKAYIHNTSSENILKIRLTPSN